MGPQMKVLNKTLAPRILRTAVASSGTPTLRRRLSTKSAGGYGDDTEGKTSVRCCKSCYNTGKKAVDSAQAKHPRRREFAPTKQRCRPNLENQVTTPLKTSTGAPMVRVCACVLACVRVCVCVCLGMVVQALPRTYHLLTSRYTTNLTTDRMPQKNG